MPIRFKSVSGFELDYVQFVYEVRNDPEVLANLHNNTAFSYEDTIAWLQSIRPKSSRWIAMDENNNKLGVVRLDNIDRKNGNCYVGLDIHKDYRGKKLAVSIYKSLLNQLFDDYNMHVVYLEVLETNQRAIKLYNKLGFQGCGIFVDKIYRDFKYINSHLMHLRKQKWYQIRSQL
jgi:RimJ/RimL family protein N-acetyltransferase